MYAVDPCQPLWAPSGKQDQDSVLYTESDCGQREVRVPRAVNVPGRREPVIVNHTIAVPHLPFVNMLDPRGNVCTVVVSNNRVARQASVSYRTSLLAHLRSLGWVRWDFLPEGSIEFEPRQYGLTPEQWLEKREELRAQRDATTQVEARAYEVKAGDKDLLKAIEGNTEALARILDKVLQQQQAGGAPSGKRGKADASAE